MKIKTFYRSTLILPIVVPLIFVFSDTFLSAILWLSIGFSGIEYIVFAIVMFYLIGKADSTDRIRRLFWWSPPIFVVFAICGWFIRVGISILANPSLSGSLGMVFIFLFYGLLVGYGYCLFIELIYRVFQSLGWIRLDQQNK